MMTTFEKFVDHLEIVAARRSGSFDADTTVSEVVAPDSIGPKTFGKILLGKFNLTSEQLASVDLHSGNITLGNLHKKLVAFTK